MGSPDAQGPDAGRPPGSSGTLPGSSGSSSTSSSTSSGDLPSDADIDATTELDASSDAESDADASQCVPLVQLTGGFCAGNLCTRAENDGDTVVLPTGTMNVSAGCGSGTINGGHIQIAEALPAAFRIETHFTIKKNQAPIVILLLGGQAPNSLSQNACDSLQANDVIVTLYRENADVDHWKLDARSKTTCQVPADANVLASPANDTQFDIVVTYDGTTLVAQGTWFDGTAADLTPSPLGGSPVADGATLAFAAYTLDNAGGSRKSVQIDKLHVLCP